MAVTLDRAERTRARRLAHPVVLAGAALIAVAMALRVPILRASYFVEDDLLFVADAYEHELTFDFLFRVHKGHLMPGALALTWVESRIAAYDHTLVAGVTFALQALAAVLLLRLLRSLFGDRWVILVPLAVYAFTPLTIPPLSWWSAALNGVPLQLALAGAIAAQVRYAGGEGTGRAAIGWAVFGMAFSTKGVFIPVTLFALTTAVLRPEWRRTGWLAAMAGELRAHRRLWGGHALVLAGYAALYLYRLPSAEGEGASVPRADVSMEIVGGLLGRTFPAGIVGGPLRWVAGPPTGGYADPPVALVAGAWAALALLVAATLWWRRRAARAWTIVALYLVVADAVPTVIARGAALGTLGAEARYVADAAVVFAVCLGVALAGVRGEAEPYRRTPPGRWVRVPAAVLAGGAVLSMSVASAEEFRQTLQGDRLRAYLDQARRALAAAPADAVILSRPVPEWLVLPWNGERRLTHRVLAPLADPALRARMRAPVPSERAMVFDDAGRLVPAAVEGEFARVPGPGEWCLPTMDGAIFWPEPHIVGRPDAVAGLAYSAERPTSVAFEVAGHVQRADLRATRDGLVHVPLPAAGTGLLIRIDDPGAGVCLKGFAYGPAVPAR